MHQSTIFCGGLSIWNVRVPQSLVTDVQRPFYSVPQSFSSRIRNKFFLYMGTTMATLNKKALPIGIKRPTNVSLQ